MCYWFNKVCTRTFTKLFKDFHYMTSMEDLSASCLFVDFINYVLLNSSVVI